MKIAGLNNFINTQKTYYSNNSQNQNNNTYGMNFRSYKLLSTFKDPNYTWIDNFVYELSNKLKVTLIPKKGPDTIAFKTVIKTGALNEIDKLRGESHFTEHLLYTGTKGLKSREIDKLASAQGAEINAITCTDNTSFEFNVSGVTQKELDELIKIHAMMIKYPSFPKGQFEKEKEIVIQEIKQSKDERTDIVFNKIIKDLLGITSTSENLVLGREENIHAITRKDIHNYHKKITHLII